MTQKELGDLVEDGGLCIEAGVSMIEGLRWSVRMQVCAVANRIQEQRSWTGTYERHTSSFVGSEEPRCLMCQGGIRIPRVMKTLMTAVCGGGMVWIHIIRTSGTTSPPVCLRPERGNEVVSGLGPHSGDTEGFKACGEKVAPFKSAGERSLA